MIFNVNHFTRGSDFVLISKLTQTNEIKIRIMVSKQYLIYNLLNDMRIYQIIHVVTPSKSTGFKCHFFAI